MVHCERCGADAVPESGEFDYCVACGLYVCRKCWHRTGFCSACGPKGGRRTVAGDRALLRRADRRLREAARESAQLMANVATGHRSASVVRSELACLELKAGSAMRARDSVLRGRIAAVSRTELTPLTRRIDRHAAGSQAAIARAVAAVGAKWDLDGPSTAVPRALAAVREAFAPLQWGPVFAVLLVVIVVVYGIYLAPRQPGVGEGVLSGGAAQTVPVSASPTPAVTTSRPPTSPPMPVEMAFNDQRIGPIVDPSWQQPDEGVGVVAFPTSFDRSVRVTTADGHLVEACVSPASTTVVLQSLSVDILLAETEGAAAVVSVRNDAGHVSVRINLARASSTVTAQGGASVASAAGIAPETWHRARVVSRTDGLHFSAAPVEDATVAELWLSVGTLDLAQRICFGVTGGAGASVHYDNVAISYRRSLDR